MKQNKYWISWDEKKKMVSTHWYLKVKLTWLKGI